MKPSDKDTTRDHKDIQQFDVFDRKYFRVIPTEFLIKNLYRTDLWGLESSCFSGVNYDLYQCIQDIKKAGQFPYNTTVGEMFCNKFNCGQYQEHSFISALVYCTQQYEHDIVNEQNERELNEKMGAEGFTKLTEEMIREAMGTEKRFYVQIGTTNILTGTAGQKQSTTKLKLTDWKEQGAHWMNPRASRSGYRAIIGQYVKEVIK